MGGKGQGDQAIAKPITPRHVAMTWARRLKRVFGIEEPEVIAKILAQREKTVPDQHQAELPLGARAPPIQARLI